MIRRLAGVLAANDDVGGTQLALSKLSAKMRY